jgi:hypothetical protein
MRLRLLALGATVAVALSVVSCTGRVATDDPPTAVTAVATAITLPPATESYGMCSPDALIAPCVVVTDTGERVLVTRAFTGDLSLVPIPSCRTEDSPAPCMWDTATQGNSYAGLNVARFILIRNQ